MEENNLVKQVYICEECNFAYKEKEFAKKCEEFCKKHHSCNTEVTKHSIGMVKLG